MKPQILIGSVLVLALGLAGGYLLGDMGGMQESTGQPSPTTTGADAREVLFYRSPMNPEVTSPVPAKGPMGMDYIPVYADGGGSGPSGTVRIDPVAVQNIGVRTALAVRRNLAREIRTVGRVDYDEKRVARLHPKTEGWIEELFIDSTGEEVQANTMLLALYSPQLVSTQEEYLLALTNRANLGDSPYPDIRSGAEQLVTSTRERLRLLDVPDHQLKELESSRRIKKTVHIHSPFDGVVVKVGARQGEFVTPKTELYTIADLSRVWVLVDVYETDLSWVAQGDQAHMTLAALPGRKFSGKITYVYPYMDSTTRTAKIRLEFPNPRRELKPGMFSDVTIHADRQVDAVVIPSEAVVRSGTHDQVFVVRQEGKFEPRLVTLGVTAEGLVQVLEGVQAGERVVTSSQFLIDSESKLNEATSKMLEVGKNEGASPMVAPVEQGNDMGAMKGHDMGAMKGHDMGAMQGHDMGAMQGHDMGAMQGRDMGAMKGRDMGAMQGHGMEAGQ